jgi:serine/threonine protein kinase
MSSSLAPTKAPKKKKIESNVEISFDRPTIDLIGKTVLSHYLVLKWLSLSYESEIFLCEDTSTKQKWVFKLYKDGNAANETILKQINEIDTPYLVKPKHIGTFKSRFYELIPYFEKGTLANNLLTLDDAFLIKILIPQLNQALKALHDQGLAHNDIKPENIFLTDDMKAIRLGDFGITYPFGDKPSGKMTPQYAAPEADERSTPMVDYFAFGLVIYELVYKKHPFHELPSAQIRRLILDGRLTVYSTIEPHLRNLIYTLLDGAPERRADYVNINQWLADPKKLPLHLKMQTKEGLRIAAYQFNKITYQYLNPLTEAMVEHWSLAKENYKDGELLKTIESTSKDLFFRTKLFREKFATDIDKGLMLTLMTMNDTLPWRIDDRIRFQNFKDYLDYLRLHSPRILPQFVDADLVLLFAENKLGDSQKKVMKNIFEKLKDPKQICEAMLNVFAEDKETWYLYDRRLKSTEDLLSTVWNHGFEPNRHPLIDSGYFVHLLMLRYDDVKLDAMGLTFEDMERATPFIRYLMITMLLNSGRYVIYHQSKRYEGFLGLIDLIKEAYFSNHPTEYDFLKKLFSKETLKTIFLLSQKKDESALKTLNSIQSYYDAHQSKYPEKAWLYAVSSLYFRFGKNPYYLFEEKKVQSLSELIHALEKTENLDFFSWDLMSDVSFAAFLEYLGYDDPFIHQIKGEKK